MAAKDHQNDRKKQNANHIDREDDSAKKMIVNPFY
jgi:hypothetical protein